MSWAEVYGSDSSVEDVLLSPEAVVGAQKLDEQKKSGRSGTADINLLIKKLHPEYNKRIIAIAEAKEVKEADIVETTFIPMGVDSQTWYGSSKHAVLGVVDVTGKL